MKFKNLRTMLLVGTMSFALALTGCGSTDASGDTTVAEEETMEVETEETEEVEEDEESTDAVVVEEEVEAEAEVESTDAKEEDVTVSEDDILAWAQDLYDYALDGDFDAVYTILEENDYSTFRSMLTIYDDEISYGLFEMDDENTLFAYSSFVIDEKYVLVAIIPAASINDSLTVSELVDIAVNYNKIEINFESYMIGDMLTRTAIRDNIMYMDYGLESPLTVDLG